MPKVPSEKPFSCPYPGCGRPYATNWNLGRHMKDVGHGQPTNNRNKLRAASFDNSPLWDKFVPMMHLSKKPYIGSLLVAVDTLVANNNALAVAKQVVRRDPITEDDLRELVQILGNHEHALSDICNTIRFYNPDNRFFETPDYATLPRLLRYQEEDYNDRLLDYHQDKKKMDRAKAELNALWQARRHRVAGRFYCDLCDNKSWKMNQKLQEHNERKHGLPRVNGSTAAGKAVAFEQFCNNVWGKTYHKYMPPLPPPDHEDCHLAATHTIYLAFRRIDPVGARLISAQLDKAQAAAKALQDDDYDDGPLPLDTSAILRVCVDLIDKSDWADDSYLFDFEREAAKLVTKEAPIFSPLSELRQYRDWLVLFDQWQTGSDVVKRVEDMGTLYDLWRAR